MGGKSENKVIYNILIVIFAWTEIQKNQHKYVIYHKKSSRMNINPK